ncbi:MAG: toxin glutamine deamidase domain-containing protein [Nocardioides sp.]
MSRLLPALLAALLFLILPAIASPSAIAGTAGRAVAYTYDAAYQHAVQQPATEQHQQSGSADDAPNAAVAWLQPASVAATGVAAKTEAGSNRGVNPLKGTENCVNCAIATDSTLAGAPMSALNSGPTSIAALERIYGGSFKSVSGQAQIERMLAQAGPGSRGIVFGGRTGDVGHVFNGVNQGGTIRFLDGQTGGAASFSGFDSFMFLRTN